MSRRVPWLCFIAGARQTPVSGAVPEDAKLPSLEIELQAIQRRVGHAARCLDYRPFSAWPPTEPDVIVSDHPALQ